jgi:GT2 family glycosyltransferase
MVIKNYSFTVAVTTFNRPDSLSDCLEALNVQTSRDFDVLVVNGGEGIDKIINSLSLSFKIKIINQQRKGLVEARNLCWKETNSDIVCIIDDDLIVSENWMEEIKKTFMIDERIGGVTGPTIIKGDGNRDAISFVGKFKNGNLFWRLIGRFYLDFILEGKADEIGKILDCGTFTLGSNFSDCLKRDELIEVDYLEACHMCFKRKLIEDSGGFDYRYTGTGEWSEPDLAFKIRKIGHRLIFNPKAATEHRVSVQGVFKARTYAFERSINFINFYFNNIKPKSISKFIRFYFYLLFMNCYWIYKAIQLMNISWLSGLAGTANGLVSNIFLCQRKD